MLLSGSVRSQVVSPDEPPKVSAGDLFCNACREELWLKRRVLHAHIKSVKHADGKQRLERKQGRERETLQRPLRSVIMGIGRRVLHFQRLKECTM